MAILARRLPSARCRLLGRALAERSRGAADARQRVRPSRDVNGVPPLIRVPPIAWKAVLQWRIFGVGNAAAWRREMGEREMQMVCPECNQPFTFVQHDGDHPPLRCDLCFEVYLRELDVDFLANYAEFGAMSHRVIAETCLRSLVMDSPGHRKVLAMEIFNQYVLAAGDLIGLYFAIRDREERPILESFLQFDLNPAASQTFFTELAERSPKALLAGLGLPLPEDLTEYYPGMDRKEAKEVRKALEALLQNFERTRVRNAGGALALGQVAQEMKGGALLTNHAGWLRDQRLNPNQVASLVLDYRRRSVAMNALTIDDSKLSEIVDAIDVMTRTVSDMIYAFLSVQDYLDRRFLLQRGNSDTLPFHPAA
jgi:hypothetical protein